MAYEFHYTPTGTGVISGKEVLEQTEDAINDLGNTAISGVQEALDKAEQALTNSENAVDDAQTALNTANNAEGVAIQAQNDVSNLSGTVTNIGNRVTTAEGNITNLQGRMTTAEGNITNLQGRMTTAEGSIGNLQTAVSTAQATANSAQQTATTARQQSYVFRYSSTALTPSSTNSNTLLDNTDNLKVGDKVIDSSGVLFSITAIDTQNSTFTIGTALIDLAQDSDVVHKSGNETITGTKTFLDVPIPFKSSTAELGVTGGYTDITFLDKNNKKLSGLTLGNYASSNLSYVRLSIFDKDVNDNEIQDILEYSYVANNSNAYLRVYRDNFCTLGSSSYRWKGVYAQNYYYGSNNVEFSTKFVTTDTNQTISGEKTFNDLQIIGYGTQYKGARNAYILPEFAAGYSGLSITTMGYAQTLKIGNFVLDANNKPSLDTSKGYIQIATGENNGVNACVLEPRNSTSSSLGTSVNKWKSFNGVEPSSLSLPSGNASDFIDISSYFSNTGTGDTNTYTALANGWIYLRLANITGCQASVLDANNNRMWGQSSTGNIEQITIPILKGQTLSTQWNTGSTVNVAIARFIPCQGNV